VRSGRRLCLGPQARLGSRRGKSAGSGVAETAARLASEFAGTAGGLSVSIEARRNGVHRAPAHDGHVHGGVLDRIAREMFCVVVPQAAMMLADHPDRGLARRAAEVMPDLQSGVIDHAPARPPRPEAEIDVLAIHEEPLIDAADPLDELAAMQ